MRGVISGAVLLLSMVVTTSCDSEKNEDTTGPSSDNAPDVDGGDGMPIAEDIVLGGPCAAHERLGGFEAVVLPEYSGVQGEVADGVVPASVRIRELEADGCTLWQQPLLECNPPCPVQETCDVDGACIPFPLNQDLGTVTVEGLNKAIAMTPRPPGNNYFDADVPHPVFDIDNDVIRLSTTSGYLDRIDLFGIGSRAIQPDVPAMVIVPGQALSVRWDAPAADPKTSVRLSIMIDQHGSTPVTLECEREDTGEAVIPAAVIDALIEQGVTGFPSMSISRSTVDSVRVAGGCVDFAVRSMRPIDVSVSGFVPCAGPGTCPDGQTCHPDTFICE